MSLIKRTWPYGTRYTGKIDVATEKLVIVVVGNEAFALANHGLFPIPETGWQAVIEFTQGGPMGGHWKIVEVIP